MPEFLHDPEVSGSAVAFVIAVGLIWWQGAGKIAGMLMRGPPASRRSGCGPPSARRGGDPAGRVPAASSARRWASSRRSPPARSPTPNGSPPIAPRSGTSADSPRGAGPRPHRPGRGRRDQRGARRRRRCRDRCRAPADHREPGCRTRRRADRRRHPRPAAQPALESRTRPSERSGRLEDRRVQPRIASRRLSIRPWAR